VVGLQLHLHGPAGAHAERRLEDYGLRRDGEGPRADEVGRVDLDAAAERARWGQDWGAAVCQRVGCVDQQVDAGLDRAEGEQRVHRSGVGGSALRRERRWRSLAFCVEIAPLKLSYHEQLDVGLSKRNRCNGGAWTGGIDQKSCVRVLEGAAWLCTVLRGEKAAIEKVE